MWERGWDEEYGGMFYFRDLRGLPVQEYWHDMKFWWPHNEAIIARLEENPLPKKVSELRLTLQRSAARSGSKPIWRRLLELRLARGPRRGIAK